LGIGSVLSNFLGTTGASMVLIRPFLAANGHRKHRAHLPIFLIFIVSNISGLLTPLGDPPLFLGFLRGVPFFWTLRLFPQWIFAVSILLAVFYCFDRFVFKDTAPVAKSDGGDKSPLKLNGKRNLLCLATIVGSVFLPTPYREIVMVAAILVTLKITPEQYHKGNNFEYHAIKEVATLFLGIFITMIPALEILQLKGASLGVTAPWQFFWASGAFSSFLDNAPTYLTFIALGQGLKLGGPFMDVPVNILIAVSVGAVFFGANTYIGNAPNFMVRSIAASSGWKMPSFFGYMLWSGCILIPLFVLVTFVFFLG